MKIVRPCQTEVGKGEWKVDASEVRDQDVGEPRRFGRFLKSLIRSLASRLRLSPGTRVPEFGQPAGHGVLDLEREMPGISGFERQNRLPAVQTCVPSSSNRRME